MPQPEIDILSKTYYEYAVKVLCGYLKEPKGAPLNAGAYYTAINIHNPGPKEAKFRVKVALANPGQPGPVLGFHIFTLRADEALELDCELLHKFAEVPGERFIKGFAVLQCATRLDVVGVYTAGALQSPFEVATLHLERVAGTLIKP
jgi:hypothetical protein